MLTIVTFLLFGLMISDCRNQAAPLSGMHEIPAFVWLRNFIDGRRCSRR
jgi:hypothetical protein